MRRLVPLVLALCPLACADASEAALYELREGDAALDATPVIPFGARIVEHAVDDDEPEEVEAPLPTSDWPKLGGAPRITVGPWLGARGDEEEDLDGTALCPFEVTTRGFPAIRADGRTIVSLSRGTWSASDGEDEVMVVSWHDVERDEVVRDATVFDGDAAPYDEDSGKRCRPLWRAAKQAAAEINAQLDAEAWRTLRHVGIEAQHAVYEWMGEDAEDEDAVPVPASARPLQVAHFGKQAVVRIPGVEVLHRATVDWQGHESWPCMLAPNVLAVLGDREHGVLAVLTDHQTGGCLCYSEIELHTLRVPDAIFAEALRRPSSQRISDEVRMTSE